MAVGLAAVSFYYLSLFFTLPVAALLLLAVYLLAANKVPVVAQGLVAALLIAGIAYQIVYHYGFQFRGADVEVPGGGRGFRAAASH